MGITSDLFQSSAQTLSVNNPSTGVDVMAPEQTTQAQTHSANPPSTDVEVIELEQTTEDETQTSSGASSRRPSDPSWGGRKRGTRRRIRARFKGKKRRLLSACSKYKWRIILTAIAFIICSAISLGVGAGVALLKCQKDASKCPPDWIAHQGHCYKLSREEKNWTESQNFCILHNASLAKITEEEMEFINNLIGKNFFRIALNKEPGQPWKWSDGENATLEVLGNGGNCAILNDGKAYSGNCSTKHYFICKKY